MKLLLLHSVAVSFILISCKPEKKDLEALRSSLKETPLTDSPYTISIPPDYKIQIRKGADFNVYYFYPADTSIRGMGAGGVYIGNFPSKFGPENETCMLSTRTGKVMDIPVSWDVYSCEGKTALETIVTLSDAVQVHLFGSAKSPENAERMQVICSTFSRK